MLDSKFYCRPILLGYENCIYMKSNSELCKKDSHLSHISKSDHIFFGAYQSVKIRKSWILRQFANLVNSYSKGTN